MLRLRVEVVDAGCDEARVLDDVDAHARPDVQVFLARQDVVDEGVERHRTVVHVLRPLHRAAPGALGRDLGRRALAQVGECARDRVLRRLQELEAVGAPALLVAVAAGVPVSEHDRDGAVLHALGHADERVDRPAVRGHGDVALLVHPELLGGGVAHLGPGAPGQTAHGVGDLLEPGPRGAASVEQVGVRVQQQRVARDRVAGDGRRQAVGQRRLF